ncbi:MAG: hypothetical protein OXP69_24530 [Spirochaetaceae bacterium]|nr:hypothetical protein [Spirochaetaceae bacterium]
MVNFGNGGSGRGEADYNYLYGLIRSREGELIDGARLRALVGMARIDEIVQICPESPFMDAFAPDLDEAALERAIASEQADLRWLIDRYAPEPALRELLLVPRDLYNIKVALRLHANSAGAAGGADPAVANDDSDQDALYGPPGTRAVAAIRVAIADDGPGLTSAGDIDRASRALAGCLERALGAFYTAGRNGQVLELAVDRLAHLFRVATADAVDQEVGSVYRDAAALAAGELLARGSAAGLPWEVARWGLLDLPSQADLETVYETPPGDWGSRLTAFNGVLRALLARIGEGMETRAAVRAAQEAVAKRIAAWRYAPPSFAFAVYYVCKKQADLAALRMICLAKLKGVGEDTIGARVGGVLMGQELAA